MPSVTKQELHLAKSLDELKKKAEIKEFGSKKIERIIEFTNKFYNEAITHLRKGDNERAYIFFFRLSTLLSYIQNESDRKKFMSVVGSKAKDALEQMDYLTTELSERYSERQKNYEDRKAKLFNQPTSIPGTSVKVFEPVIDMDNDDEYYKCIDSNQLVQSIQSLSEISKILIIDIRSPDDFVNSSIAANKFSATGEVNIINIPKDVISSGLTYPLLRNKISFGVTLDGLERRRSMDHVIIIDENTSEFDKSFKSCQLADALWKWDQSPDKIKNKPLLLKGGYYDFLLTYPMYTTNSKLMDNFYQPITLPSFEKNNQTKFYDFFNEDKSETNNKLNNGQSEVIPLNNQNKFGSNSSNNVENKSLKIPGIARPIIPDRSSKPNFESLNNKIPRDNINSAQQIDETEGRNQKYVSNQFPFENSRKNLPPKPAHLISSLKNGNKSNGSSEYVNNNDDKHKVDNNDNDDLVADQFNESDMHITELSAHERNEVFPMDEEMSDYENQNSHHLNNDSDNESMLHSISKPLEMNNNNDHHHNQPFSSSLSRSLSSPNIAQYEQKFSYSNESSNSFINSNSPKFSPQIPLVDRSAKPLSYINNLRKARDFSPQFSSCARITGLRNLGNTCFMNSMLQCLKNTREFYEYLVSGNVHINPNSKFGSNGELTIELMELFKQMHHPSNFKHISPKDFKSAVSRHIPDFIDYKQQDAHEFLVRLLDRIHADLNRSKPNADIYDPVIKDPNYYDKLSMKEAVHNFWTLHVKRNNSIVTDLFEGLIVSTLTCLHCKSSSKALEAFTCLTLPIPENTTRTSLKNCINLFLRGERISNEAAWQCQECQQRRDAEKCTFIWKLPKILIIHLKRFTYDGMWRQKISTFVDFPIENLSIESHGIGENRSYSLYGVVNHFGSLEGGHYVAYSRNKELNIDWNRYDDQDVSSISANDVVTQNAYVLFYKSF